MAVLKVTWRGESFRVCEDERDVPQTLERNPGMAVFSLRELRVLESAGIEPDRAMAVVQAKKAFPAAVVEKLI